MRLIKPALVYALGALKSLWEDAWGSWLKAFYYTNFRQNANNVTGLYWAQMHPHTPDLPLHVHHEQGISTVWVRCIPKKIHGDTSRYCPSVTKRYRCCLEEDSGVTWPKKQSYCQSPANRLAKTWNHSEREIPRCLLTSVPALLCPTILFILPAFQHLKSEQNPWSLRIAPCFTLYWGGFEFTIFEVILL